jgi:hypothetical protein
MPQPGKAYIVVDVDEKGEVAGMPVWAFAICPTIPLTDNFDISRQGMDLRPRYTHALNLETIKTDIFPVFNKEGKQVYDMWDWIGAENYPNPMDWLEEVMKLGFHQLVQRTLQFNLLTPESNYYAVHARAGIVDPTPYWRNVGARKCPRDIPDHNDNHVDFGITCHRILYDALVDGEPLGKDTDAVKRTMPSFTYTGAKVLDGTEFYPAAFFKLPIGRMAYWRVYEDKEMHTEKAALDALKSLDERLQVVKIVSL